MHQISNEELAKIVCKIDFFYNRRETPLKPEVDALEILFGYGDHIILMIQKGYLLENLTDGLRCIIEVLKELEIFFKADNAGVIDAYVIEPIIDSGKLHCEWFKGLLSDSERNLILEVQNFDRAIN